MNKYKKTKSKRGGLPDANVEILIDVNEVVKHPDTKDKVPVGEIVDKVFNDVTECNFETDKTICSTTDLLEQMKQYAKLKGTNINTNDGAVIVDKVKNLFNCESESCIFKQKDFMNFAKLDNYILEKLFKPSGPANNYALLSNFNIDGVLDDLTKRFPERKFYHIPFQMRDFEKVGSELAEVDLFDLFESGTKTFGVVLNTDWSSGGGIHWFCIFGEHYGDKIVIEYFNSSGKQPLPEVQAWLHKTKHYLDMKYNKKINGGGKKNMKKEKSSNSSSNEVSTSNSNSVNKTKTSSNSDTIYSNNVMVETDLSDDGILVFNKIYGGYSKLKKSNSVDDHKFRKSSGSIEIEIREINEDDILGSSNIRNRINNFSPGQLKKGGNDFVAAATPLISAQTTTLVSPSALTVPTTQIYKCMSESYQNDNHSCGVYCLAYIWLRLEGIPYNWFTRYNFNDEMMHKLRKNLFRHEK